MVITSCQDCRKWEEYTYWTRFQSLHFYTVLPEDPHLQLVIPKKFVKNLKEELPEIMGLRGPSGHNWEVGLVRNGEDLCLTNGWEEFVKDHDLEKGDMLCFNYNGDSRFEVLMFDESFCEKATCYFVKKCGGCSHVSTEKRARESSMEITSAGNSSRSKQRKDVSTEMPPPVTPLQLPSTSKKNKKPRSKSERSSGSKRKYTKRAELSLQLVEQKVEKGSDSDGYKLPEEASLRYKLYFLSKRRPVTDEELSKTYQLASQSLDSKKPQFLRTMAPTHVSYSFFMAVPVDVVWSSPACLPSKDDTVILVVEGKRWPVKYISKEKGKSAGITGSGWSNFVFDNNLEVGDVCLFELSRKKNEFLMEVRIYRVVEVVEPLKRMTYSKMAKENSVQPLPAEKTVACV